MSYYSLPDYGNVLLPESLVSFPEMICRAAAQIKKSKALNEAVKRLRTTVNTNRPPASPARLL